MPDLIVAIGATLSFDDPLVHKAPGWRLVDRFVEKLRAFTTNVNPAYSKAKIAGRWVSEKNESIALLTRKDGRVHVPRGCLTELRSAAKSVGGIYIQWDPKVISNGTGQKHPTCVERDGFALRPEYQPEIVQRILDRRQGVIVLPCGGGKTISGVSAVVASGESAVVLVHTEDLLDQWEGAFKFVTGTLPRVIGGRRRPNYTPLRPGEHAVCMVQTLKPNLNDYRALLGSAGFLMIDECHHTPAEMVRSVIAACPGRFRIGLSATPDRADGFGFLLYALIGPKLFQLSAEQLIEWGYLRRPLCFGVDSGWSPSIKSYEWEVSCPECMKSPSVRRTKRADQVIRSAAEKKLFSAGRLPCKRKGRISVKCSWVFTGEEKITRGKMISALVSSEAATDQHRVNMASLLAKEGTSLGRRVLTLSNRKDGVKAIEKAQKNLGAVVRGVTSGTSKDDRSAIMGKFRSGVYQSMVATQLADEGLDVPDLDLLINTSGGRHSGTAQQRAGRTTRLGGDEVPLVLDIVDSYPAAISQWHSRSAAYFAAYGKKGLPTKKRISLQMAKKIMAMLADGASRMDVIKFVTR